ncbi:hypothetical protein SCP_0900660 [Sparassis crispa]|uniref:Thiolase N-terminal domain-containing protein n=1 Tax=Sparassis crispa TaxID=139825 RepID=A0A401GVD7_9APHY|nr:hypothetical protein SCP_0900660 [Sparassis crispa]GBE86188.1 hypothetical protein SCP_0900660 [Sparassis crispa]
MLTFAQRTTSSLTTTFPKVEILAQYDDAASLESQRCALFPPLAGPLTDSPLQANKGDFKDIRRLDPALIEDIPNTVPINTVNRQCSSGLSTINHITAEIVSGQIDIGIGAGVESMAFGYGALGLAQTKGFSETSLCARSRGLPNLDGRSPSSHIIARMLFMASAPWTAWRQTCLPCRYFRALIQQ